MDVLRIWSQCFFIFILPITLLATSAVLLTPRRWEWYERLTWMLFASVLVCFAILLFENWHAIAAGPFDLQKSGGIYMEDHYGWEAVLLTIIAAVVVSIPVVVISSVFMVLALTVECRALSIFRRMNGADRRHVESSEAGARSHP